MKYVIRLLTVTLFLLVCFSLYAQQRKVEIAGTITDASTGEILPGVSVQISGTNVGTCTNEHGAYSLSYTYPAHHHSITLVVRSMGYKTFIAVVDKTGRKKLDLKLSRDYLNLEGVTVTATRTEKTLSFSPIVTKLISNMDIQRVNAPSVKDLLEYEIPGVEFSSHGGQTNIKMQGFESGYILFLIDGEELSGQSNGSIDLQRISPDQIERIEVVKGAGSALYGSNAVAGVINIITKTSKKALSLFASLGYNQPKHYSAYGQVGVNKKAIRSTTTASYDDSHAYKIYNKDSKDYSTMPRNRVYRVGEKLLWNPSQTFNLKANLGYTDRTMYKSTYEQQVNRTLSGYLSGICRAHDNDSWTLTANQDVTLRGVHFPNNPSQDSTAYRNYLSMIRLQNDRVCGDHFTVNVGMEYHAEGINSFQIDNNLVTKWAQWGVLYGQVLHYLNKNLSLVYGTRFDLHSNYGLHFSPKLGFVASVNSFKFRGGYSYAFKAPNLMELYFNWYHENGGGFRIYGNKYLKPETARQFNISGEYTKGRISISASSQYTTFQNKIVMTQDEHYNLHHSNASGSSPIFGAEANLIWRPLDAIRLSVNYAYVHEKTTVDFNGKSVDVSSTRPHSFTSQISYILSRPNYYLDCSLMGRYNSGLRTNVVTSGRAGNTAEAKSIFYEPYLISRLSINQRFFNKYALSLGIDNLLNYKTDRFSSLSPLTPGRSLFAKISVSL